MSEPLRQVLPPEHRRRAEGQRPRVTTATNSRRAPEAQAGATTFASVKTEIRAKLVVHGAMGAAGIEQYRRLGATLHDLQLERGLKALTVTSALPQDGKTLTAVNLALTLVDSYSRRVLLIDADLRRPSIHEVFGISNSVGLRDALVSPSSELPTFEMGSRLSIIPAGKPTRNPLAGLSSGAMRTLLDDCEKRFDWVLLDAPPVGLLPDAQLLSRLTGAVIFVIRAGATPFALAERAIRELGRDCILGTVLNGVDEGAIPETNYYRGYL
jgi:capsular exopolysaccharide synthesis family protein